MAKKNRIKPDLDILALLNQGNTIPKEEVNEPKNTQIKEDDDLTASGKKEKEASEIQSADQPQGEDSVLLSSELPKNRKKNLSLDQQARNYEKEVLSQKGENHYKNFDNYFIGETSTERRMAVFMPENLRDTLKTIVINCGSSSLEVFVKNIVLDFLLKNKDEIKKRMDSKRNEILKNVF